MIDPPDGRRYVAKEGDRNTPPPAPVCPHCGWVSNVLWQWDPAGRKWFTVIPACCGRLPHKVSNPNDLLTAVIRREMTGDGFRLVLQVTRNPSAEAGALLDAMTAGLRRVRRHAREEAGALPVTIEFSLEEGTGPKEPSAFLT